MNITAKEIQDYLLSIEIDAPLREIRPMYKVFLAIFEKGYSQNPRFVSKKLVSNSEIEPNLEEAVSVDCEVVTDEEEDDDDFSDDPFFQSEFFDLLCKKILPSIRKTGKYRPQTEEEHQILDDFFNQSEYSEEELEWYNRLKGTVEEELSPAQKLIQMGEALREQEKSSDELYVERIG